MLSREYAGRKFLGYHQAERVCVCGEGGGGADLLQRCVVASFRQDWAAEREAEIGGGVSGLDSSGAAACRSAWCIDLHVIDGSMQVGQGNDAFFEEIDVLVRAARSPPEKSRHAHDAVTAHSAAAVDRPTRHATQVKVSHATQGR